MTSVVAKPSPEALSLRSIHQTFPGLQPVRASSLLDALKDGRIRVGNLGGKAVFDSPFTCPAALGDVWKRQIELRQGGRTLPQGQKFLWELDWVSQSEVLKAYLERDGIRHPSLVCDFFMGADTWMIELVVALLANLKMLAYLPLCHQFRFDVWT